MKSRQMFQISQNNMHRAFFVVPCNLFQSDVKTVDQIHHVYNQLDEVQAEKEDRMSLMASVRRLYPLLKITLWICLGWMFHSIGVNFQAKGTSPICDLENCLLSS